MKYSVELPTGESITEDSTPYVIAELNTSHFGKVELAIEAAEQAKAAGANVLKLQSWSTDSLFTTSYLEDRKVEARIYDKFSLSFSELSEISAHCQEIGIGFASTPYTHKEIDELVSLPGVPFVKIASMDVPNVELLTHAAETGFPIILSTGMSTYEEVSRAVEAIENISSNKLIVLHCTSVYPTETSRANLRNISGLMELFPETPIGYSDHTIGYSAAVAAVALGSRVFEKHFTLDNSKLGFDNSMATQPDDLKEYVGVIRATFEGLGSYERILDQAEISQKLAMRRSIFTASSIPAGKTITREMLQLKRPGNGMDISELKNVIGKTALDDIPVDFQISPSEFA